MNWKLTLTILSLFRKEELKKIWRSYGNISMPNTFLNLTKTNFSPKLIKFWARIRFRTRLISQQIFEELEAKVMEKLQDCLKVSFIQARFNIISFTIKKFIFCYLTFFAPTNLCSSSQFLFKALEAKLMKFHFYRIYDKNLKGKWII